MIYQYLLRKIEEGQKLVAVLIDPDKMALAEIPQLAKKIEESLVDFILVGGSVVPDGYTEGIVRRLKQYLELPIIIFPGDLNQLTDCADALLLLTLISGRNPEYLIGKQVEAAQLLSKMKLETISTGYMLLGEDNDSAVERVTSTRPIAFPKVDEIVNTALAGELLGNKLIYLEGGSGAKNAIPTSIVKAVKSNISIPLIVGGGIRSLEEIESLHQSGADVVVIGTAFEEDCNFFDNTRQFNSHQKKFQTK